MNLLYVIRAHVPLRSEEPADIAAASDAAAAADVAVLASIPLGDGHYINPAVAEVDLQPEDTVAMLALTERERTWLTSSLGRIAASYDDEPAPDLYAKLEAIETDLRAAAIATGGAE